MDKPRVRTTIAIYSWQQNMSCTGIIGREAFSILREKLWPTGSGLLLDTEHDNRRAQQFWRSVGFTEYQIRYICRPSP